jgi:hypothetical protein
MSLIMENLDQTYSPVPNFRVVTFQAGNINLKKIREVAGQTAMEPSLMKSVSISSDKSFDFDD